MYRKELGFTSDLSSQYHLWKRQIYKAVSEILTLQVFSMMGNKRPGTKDKLSALLIGCTEESVHKRNFSYRGEKSCTT